MRYWIKFPGPGEFRGQGQWTEVTKEEYESCSVDWLPKQQSEDKPKGGA